MYKLNVFASKSSCFECDVIRISSEEQNSHVIWRDCIILPFSTCRWFVNWTLCRHVNDNTTKDMLSRERSSIQPKIKMLLFDSAWITPTHMHMGFFSLLFHYDNDVTFCGLTKIHQLPEWVEFLHVRTSCTFNHGHCFATPEQTFENLIGFYKMSFSYTMMLTICHSTRGIFWGWVFLLQRIAHFTFLIFRTHFRMFLCNIKHSCVCVMCVRVFWWTVGRCATNKSSLSEWHRLEWYEVWWI